MDDFYKDMRTLAESKGWQGDMKELDKALEAYQDTFDDSFPMAALTGTPPEEVIRMIQDCIKTKKDVYEIGFLDTHTIY